MNKLLRGRRALSPLLFATTLPAAGLTLLGVGGPARAQSSILVVESVSPTATTTLQAKPAAPPQDAKPTAPPVDPNASVISEIIVVGAKTLSQTFIIAASGHNVGDPCNTDVLSDMRTRLYATKYFGGHSIHPEEDAVRVEAAEKEKGKCKVTITVDENETITGINLTGTGPIKPEEVLPKLNSNLKPGMAYNDQQFLLDALDIQDMYRKRGYIATLTDSSIDEKGVLNVTIVVTRVAEIKIVGNHKTRRNVILRAMNTKTNDYLNINTLDRDQANLLNLDLFEEVKPTDFPLGAGRVGITINVVEKRTGTVTAGVGYSNRAQLIGFGEIVETNFRGMGEAVNLRGEVGGAAGRTSIELGFNEPYLDRKRTALALQLYDKTVYRFSNNLGNNIATQSTTGSDSRYNEQRIGATATLSRPFLQTYRAALSLRGEDVHTDALDLSVQNAQIIQNGPIIIGGASLFHNTRDIDLDPISGGLQTGSVSIGHADLRSPRTFTGITIPGVTGSVNFSKLSLEARQYFSLSGPRHPGKLTEDKSSVAMRFLLGSSVGTLPFFEQFFVGGGENLRGYRDDRFWGNNLFLGSIEFRQPIAKRLKGVLFADLGDAWGGSYSNVSIPGFTQDNFHPHLGVGLGIRVNTPIGPLRLDYGIGDEGGRTHFSIGPTF